MYFSQVINTLDVDTYILVIWQKTSEVVYDGHVKEMPFRTFRKLHDSKVTKIVPMYDNDAKIQTVCTWKSISKAKKNQAVKHSPIFLVSVFFKRFPDFTKPALKGGQIQAVYIIA